MSVISALVAILEASMPCRSTRYCLTFSARWRASVSWRAPEPASGLSSLIVIAYRLVRPGEGHGHKVREVTTLRAAIVTILAADLAMSLENILGVGAAAHGNIALLLFGLGLSIPIVLFGSGIVVGLLDRFPQATWVGAVAILWTGADLIVSEPALASLHQLPFVELLLTLGLLGIVVAARFRRAALARVGARPRSADRRERRAS